MVARCVQGALIASVLGIAVSLGYGTTVVHADTLGTCDASASADASAYDHSSSGSSSGTLSASGYSASDCVGLSQTFAIYQAGLACENAGIPAGMASGIGYAVVTWSMLWTSDAGDTVSGGPVVQQYDCGDTFS